MANLLPVGTAVKLEGLSSAEYNGKKGRVAVTSQEMAARGRLAVIVDGATLSFKRANVRRYFPSDDSDESESEDETSTIVGTCVEINQCVGCDPGSVER